MDIKITFTKFSKKNGKRLGVYRDRFVYSYGIERGDNLDKGLFVIHFSEFWQEVCLHIEKGFAKIDVGVYRSLGGDIAKNLYSYLCSCRGTLIYGGEVKRNLGDLLDLVAPWYRVGNKTANKYANQYLMRAIGQVNKELESSGYHYQINRNGSLGGGTICVPEWADNRVLVLDKDEEDLWDWNSSNLGFNKKRISRDW